MLQGLHVGPSGYDTAVPARYQSPAANNRPPTVQRIDELSQWQVMDNKKYGAHQNVLT